MKAIVPTVLIMIGCIMLGSGLYLGRVAQYEKKVITVSFVKGSRGYQAIYTESSMAGTSVDVYKGECAPDERRVVVLFTEIPRPENIMLYNIENVIITLTHNVDATIAVSGRDATVNDWRDFVINVGKLKHPEYYLNPDWSLWNFDMDVLYQFNTAELKIGSPYTVDWMVRQNYSDTSFKFKYNNENIIGIGFLPTTVIPYPPYLWYRIVLNVGLQFEGIGLVKLYGYVYDKDGNPTSNVCVSCDFGITYTDENGYYEINVAVGELTVNYSKDGYENQSITTTIPDRDNYRVDVILTKLTIPTPEENVPEENILENIPTYTPPERYPIDKSKVLIFGGVGMILMGLVSLMIILTQNVRREMRI